MDNLPESFRKTLKRILDSGVISKVELSQKAGINRGMINRYLKGAVPSLDIIEKIAEALEIDPVELIKPIDKNKSISLPHTLDDCLEVVAKAAKGNISVVSSKKKSEEQLIPDHLLKKIRGLNDSDKEVLFLQIESSLKALSNIENLEDSETG